MRTVFLPHIDYLEPGSTHWIGLARPAVAGRVSRFSFAALTLFVLVFGSPAGAVEIRSIDGSGNNVSNPGWGSAGVELLRLTPAAYDDGVGVPRGGNPTSLPSAREVSNAVSSQSGSLPNAAGATDWLWQWGQFLDHDLDLTPLSAPGESFNVTVPVGDVFFDPFDSGMQEISFSRSAAAPNAGPVREQFNEITAFIDASNIYGSDTVRAAALRDIGNDGKMKMVAGTSGEMNLIFNTVGLPNDGNLGASGYLSGDFRANEQIGLTAVHTLFSREHNRIAEDLKSRLVSGEQSLVDKREAAIAEPGNGIVNEDDFLYQSARKLVSAQMQKITYEEFLPTLLGSGALTPYQDYNDAINPGISNEFATAAYRIGHTMLSSEILRVDNTGSVLDAIALQDAFFSPSLIDLDGVDTLLKGLASQRAQSVDTFLIDDVRNFLFGPPGAGGLDLASLNIQRGRDHGLGSYTEVRNARGLGAVTSFLQMTGGDSALAQAFADVYASVEEVDLWAGGLAEIHVGGGMVGETFRSIIVDQFERTRDGDRFFFETQAQLDHLLVLDPNFLTGNRLSDIIRRNTSISDIQDDVFRIASATGVSEPAGLSLALGCALVPLFRRLTRV